MRGPYTRFHLLKKRNIFEDGLEPADHVETASKNRVSARAIFCLADAGRAGDGLPHSELICPVGQISARWR
jgi:hypothetical protein